MPSSKTNVPADASSRGLASLAVWWRGLAGRERALVGVAGFLVGAAVCWWVALAPALATIRMAAVQMPRLEFDIREMQGMRVQAQALTAQSRLTPQETRRQLESSVSQTLGAAAQLQVNGDRATVTLKGVTSEALAQWLVQTRANARLVPVEARLTRNVGTGATTAVSWDGNVMLVLPPTL